MLSLDYQLVRPSRSPSHVCPVNAFSQSILSLIMVQPP